MHRLYFQDFPNFGGYPDAPPTDKPIGEPEYTSYPSCESIIIGGTELATGDFVIAQIAGMWGGIRTDRSYMNEAIKIIEILSAHIVYNTKGGEIHLGKKGSLISKTEFLARDFRRITGAEKKYLTW